MMMTMCELFRVNGRVGSYTFKTGIRCWDLLDIYDYGGAFKLFCTGLASYQVQLLVER